MIFDPIYLLFMVPALLLSLFASWRTKAAFNKYSRVLSASGLTGAQAAQRMLSQAGITDVSIVAHRGRLTDHYNPVTKTLALSEPVYGQPSIADGLQRLFAARVERLLVLPLYPQYSAATTGSTFDAVTAALRRWRWVPELRFINHYHDHESYIAALAESIRVHQARHGVPERLLFSFHGLPKHYFLAGDPYYCHCHKTARLVALQLGLQQQQWEVSFQSRFGPREWLQPYTAQVLKDLAKKKTGRVDVACPGFVSDCLETLEEIAIEARGDFLKAGGGELHYIPCLNERDDWIHALTDIVLKNVLGWSNTATADSLKSSRDRALQLGAKK